MGTLEMIAAETADKNERIHELERALRFVAEELQRVADIEKKVNRNYGLLLEGRALDAFWTATRFGHGGPGGPVDD